MASDYALTVLFFSISLFIISSFRFPFFSDAYTRRDFYVAGVATHRETNTAADGGSGFVIASDAVMHHTKVDGKRIARPPWCQSVFLGNCCGNSLYRARASSPRSPHSPAARDERRGDK